MSESLFLKHKLLMKRIADAVLELCEASIVERDFYKKAEKERKRTADLLSGAHIGLNPDFLEGGHSKPAVWFRDLVAWGYIDPEEVPEKYREAWGLRNVPVKIQRD